MKQEMSACALRVGTSEINAETKTAASALGRDKGFSELLSDFSRKSRTSIEYVHAELFMRVDPELDWGSSTGFFVSLQRVSDQVV